MRGHVRGIDFVLCVPAARAVPSPGDASGLLLTGTYSSVATTVSARFSMPCLVLQNVVPSDIIYNYM